MIPFSCTFLVKWNIGAFRNWLVSKRDFSTSQIEYQIDYFSGQLQVGLFNTDNSGSIRKEYNWIPTVGQWYHITVTYDGTALQSSLGLYIDAVSIGATREVGTFTGMTLGTSRVLFGKAGFNSTYYLTGELDCIRFWDKELTQTEVTEIATEELSGIDINP